MTDETQDDARANRDHDRSAEAHWQVAEAEAERLEAADQSDEREDDWENKGGALDREPKQRSQPPRRATTDGDAPAPPPQEPR